MLAKAEIETLTSLSNPDISSEALEIAEHVARLMRENRQLKEENEQIRARIAQEEARIDVQRL